MSKKRKTRTRAEISDAVSEKKKILARSVALKVIENPSMPFGQALKEAGASQYAQVNPHAALTSSREWLDIIDEYLPQTDLAHTHRGLLKASRVEHINFIQNEKDLSDEDISKLFAEIGCTVRKIIHRETGARDVYFFAPDSKARATGLDMAYKLRGSYAGDKAAIAFSLAALAAAKGGSTALLPSMNRGAPRLPEQS